MSYQNSERPPIDGLVVRLVVDDLRRDVVRGAAKGLGGVVAQYLLLAHSEVRDLDVTVLKEWAGIEDARFSSLHRAGKKSCPLVWSLSLCLVALLDG